MSRPQLDHPPHLRPPTPQLGHDDNDMSALEGQSASWCPGNPATVQTNSCDSSSARSYLTPPPPDDEQDDRASSSGSDTDTNDEYEPTQEYTLPSNHKWQRLRPELKQFSKKRFYEWSGSTRYHEPPDDRLPPRKRCRTSSWRPESPCDGGNESDSDSDGEFVVIPRPGRQTGYFHLACPYYVSDPDKYRQCLFQDDNQSIEGLIEHIRRHHMKPFYCPMCSQTFDSVISRDDHILEKTCELRNLRHIDGINEHQKALLTRRDKWYLGEAKRWQRIWTTVFPHSKPPHSPYLDQGCGLKASMLRDYWDICGRLCVSQFLESSGIQEEDEEEDERAQNALCSLVLETLLTEIVQEHELD